MKLNLTHGHDLQIADCVEHEWIVSQRIWDDGIPEEKRREEKRRFEA
jgi:hypothetical protein